MVDDIIEVCSRCGKVPRSIDFDPGTGQFHCSRCGNAELRMVNSEDFEEIISALEDRFTKEAIKAKSAEAGMEEEEFEDDEDVLLPAERKARMRQPEVSYTERPTVKVRKKPTSSQKPATKRTSKTSKKSSPSRKGLSASGKTASGESLKKTIKSPKIGSKTSQKSSTSKKSESGKSKSSTKKKENTRTSKTSKKSSSSRKGLSASKTKEKNTKKSGKKSSKSVKALEK